MNFMKKVLPFSPSCALYRSPTEGTQQHGQGVAISRRHHSGGYGGSPPIWKPWTAMHMIVLYTHSDSQIPRNKVRIDYLIFPIFYFIYDYLFWSRSRERMHNIIYILYLVVEIFSRRRREMSIFLINIWIISFTLFIINILDLTRKRLQNWGIYVWFQ